MRFLMFVVLFFKLLLRLTDSEGEHPETIINFLFQKMRIFKKNRFLTLILFTFSIQIWYTVMRCRAKNSDSVFL